MIAGVGIDIASRDRFRGEDERFGDNFLVKIFSPDEITACRSYHDPYQYFAAFFALKEAVMKALGFGLTDGASFLDITVDTSDGIRVHLSGKTRLKAEQLGVGNIYVSFSCNENNAVAVAVAEG